MSKGKNKSSAPGILLVLNDVARGAEDEFNRWYQQQHVPERLAVKGFRTARRYRVLKGDSAYMAVYECDCVEVLASRAYRERLAHPTDWTRRIMPSFRNMLRSACRQTWSAGDGVGGGAIIVQCSPDAGKSASARGFVMRTLTREFMQSASLVRVALWEADASASGGPSPEARLRGTADRAADWVLFLESFDLPHSAAAIRFRALARAARAAGLRLAPPAQYQLMHARRSGD